MSQSSDVDGVPAAPPIAAKVFGDSLPLAEQYVARLVANR